MSRTSTAASERRSPSWRQEGLAAACVFAVVATVWALPFAHVRMVLTPSIPRGLYLLKPDGVVAAGDLLAFCPPSSFAEFLVRHHLEPRGDCPGGSLPLAKKLLAINPFVCSSPAGLVINGTLHPWPSVPPDLPLKRLCFCGRTPPGCLFFLGSSADSLDSRLFGCVPASSVLGRLVPILTEAAPS